MLIRVVFSCELSCQAQQTAPQCKESAAIAYKNKEDSSSLQLVVDSRVSSSAAGISRSRDDNQSHQKPLTPH